MPCVFCHQNVPLTAEHVFPAWTRPFLADPEGGHGTHTRITIRAEGPDEERSHFGQAATLTVRSVCADCNNGWMSRLEGAASPFLLTMLRGNSRTYYEGGRRLIATWLLKTALVAGSKFDPALPTDFYDHLYLEQRPSENTRVWLAATPYVQHHQSDFRPIKVTSDADDGPPDLPNALSALIVVGQFAGFVVSWLDAVPSTNRLLTQFKPALTLIWPPTVGTATWPPTGGRLDFAALDALADAIISADELGPASARPNR